MHHHRPRVLIILTLIVFGAAIWLTIELNQDKLPPPVQIDTKGQPTIGYPKAMVSVVSFEDPKCSDCKRYSNEVFPKIKKNYIEKNLIEYTLIPVSFIPDSMPMANAWYCVYFQKPHYPNADLFFKFVEYTYQHQLDEHTNWATPQKILQFAKNTSQEINIEKLTQCDQTNAYRDEIVNNTTNAQKIMGGTLTTPTVYVNGIRAESVNYSDVSKLIDRVLKEKGVQP